MDEEDGKIEWEVFKSVLVSLPIVTIAGLIVYKLWPLFAFAFGHMAWMALF